MLRNLTQQKRPFEKDLVSGKRCRILILKSLYINRIAKEPFRCTTLWSCVKNVRLLAVVSAFQYDANIRKMFFYRKYYDSIR